MTTVLVFGASGAVGGFLLPRLGPNYKVLPVSRGARANWVVADLNDPATWPAADVVISLGPLDAFAVALDRQVSPPRRVIALSSMSAESKRESPDPAERELAARLRAAETAIFAIGAERGLACTIFRPTLIYGAGIDRSLAPIARFARRWHVLPIPLGATGLRQPVHAADLAEACLAAIDNAATYGKTYALGGGERLSFAAMLRKLRAAQRRFIVPLPVPLFALRASIGSFGIAPGALARLRESLVADSSAAETDFGYAPRAFDAGAVLPAQSPHS